MTVASELQRTATLIADSLDREIATSKYHTDQIATLIKSAGYFRALAADPTALCQFYAAVGAFLLASEWFAKDTFSTIVERLVTERAVMQQDADLQQKALILPTNGAS